MKQLDYNYIKDPPKQIYPHNSVSNYNKKRSTGLNPYPGYTNLENKPIKKTLSIYNTNESLIPQTNYQNNENKALKNPALTNYYSYQAKKMNYRDKNSSQNLSLMEQYSLKENLESKNYLNYLQKRNTYDSQSKNGNIKNIFHYDIQKLNTSGNDEYYYYNKNFNKNLIIQNYKKIPNEKNLLFYKLNSSKSTNELFYGDSHDILIEYNNAPIINSKRNICNYKNSFSNDNINYKFHNSNNKKRKDLKNENYNEEILQTIKKEKKNTSNRILNYESYVRGGINKNRMLITDNYFDIDLSKIENNNENITGDNSYYNYILDNKKKFYEEKKNKINNNAIKITCSYNPSLTNYQINTNENQYKYNNKNNNCNVRNNNNYYNSCLSKTKSANFENNKNQKNTQKINVNNNQSINIISPKASTISNIKNSNKGITNSTLTNNKADNSNDNSILKKCNKSKKDLLNNKDYQKIGKIDNSQKKNNSNTSEIKINKNNEYNAKINKNLLSLYYSKSIMNNMNCNEQNKDEDYEIYELQYTNNNNKKNNDKNILNRNKIVLFKKDKVNNSIDNKNAEKEKYENNLNLNSGFEKKKPTNKKSNLTECYNSPENINYLEARNHTSRLNNSKIINNNYLIFSNDNINNDEFKLNNIGFKSSKNMGKKEAKFLNNLISERKVVCNSPPLNNNLQYNSNRNRSNINIANINFNENNSKYNYQNNNQTKNISKLISNKKEEKNNKRISYINENKIKANNNEFKNENKKKLTNDNINNINKHVESNDILKNINNNKNKIKSSPVKLCFKNEEIKSNKQILKEKKEINDKNHNNKLRNANVSNNNSNYNIKIRKYNSAANNIKASKNNLINENKTNNKIININNNTSNVNVLNVKNSSINICIEKKDSINIISPSKNINYASPSIQKKNSKYKNNQLNVKNVANELFENNHNLKNFYILKPKINKINSNIINSHNNPSYIKISTNTIRYNNLNINNKPEKNDSNTNALSKSNNDKNYNSYYNINNIINNNINNKKKLVINKSKVLLYDNNKIIEIFPNTNVNNKNNKKISYNLKEKSNKNNNKSKNNKYKGKDTKYNDLKTNNINPIKSENREKNNINLINYYKKINIPLISTNNSIQLNFQNNNNKNKSPTGVYIKPYCILSISKSKKNIKKSKSELKLNNIINKNNNKKEIISSLKKSQKTSKSLNSEFFFHTSPSFYQKDEYFKNYSGSIKRRSVGSVNTSTLTKHISKDNIPDNENNLSYENNNFKNSTIINNIRDAYQKSYCFITKICNYYIKMPKIEKGLFIKNKINKNKFIKYTKDNNKKTQLLIQEIFINNNDEEKNNESSQNGLLMTFGEMNNKRNNEKSYGIINNNSKTNNNEIYEDSDLDIYKSLQQVSSPNQIKNDKISVGYSSNINYSENEDLKIYESLEKEKNIFNIFNSEIYKSTNGKEVDDDFEDKKSKTFKKLDKLENAEKGLKILGKLVLRRGIKSNEDSMNQNFHTEDNNSSHKNNENIYLGTNKLNELFNSRKETESSNNDKQNNDINNSKKKVKYSKSLNKDIAKGISKIENVFEKNKNELGQIKINTYDAKNKIYCDSNLKYNDYYDIMNYSEKIKPKIRTYMTKSKANCGSSDENNTLDSCLELNNNNIRIPRYKESEILANKHKNELINSIEGRDSILPIKCNLLNDEIFNNCNDLLSYSEEDLKSFDLNINLEEFEKYLKEIKNKQSNNIIKHDIIFLLNILVENNYSSILNQITKLILYKSNDNILYDRDEIVENEHSFKNSIFTHISRNVKYIFLYARLCKDLNKNILNALREQVNIKNNKERNLKLIINDECISILNKFKNIEINAFKNKEKHEYYYLRKKMIGFATFVYELIKLEFFKQQFGFFILEQFYKIYIDKNNLNIYIETILILLNDLGKLVFEKNNIKYIESINNFIDIKCNKIFNNNDKNKIPNHLRYKFINLISKRNNNWEDNFDEILKKQEEDLDISIKEGESKKESINKINKIFNKEINIDDVNKSIIEEDLVNYISYYTEETNNGQTNIKNNIDKSYNWKIIEELVNNQNFDLESIINYFISVCTNIINDDNQIIISNDYIKNIIEYYTNNLSKKARDSIHNEMIKSFLKIDEFVNKNKNMYKILGNLLFILIDNKLYHIKYFNNYLKVEKQTQINLAIITKYCILSSGKFAKKYLNDFKQTKLFINNEIFSKYVNEALKDLLYFIK